MVFSLFLFVSAHAIDVQYSQNYFDPERIGESQWSSIDSLKNPSEQIDLGRIKVASVELRYFKIRVANNSSSNQSLSFLNLPVGFKWKNDPPTQILANQKLELPIELESSAIGKKFADIQINVAGENKAHKIRITFEVQE